MRSEFEDFPDPAPPTSVAKFTDPDITAKGERRASVPLDRLDTLWINTGTLCNITCANCYIESSPRNDRLVYMTRAEVAALLDEAKAIGTREIGFTGGEPFLNPDIIGMLDDAMAHGFQVLVLTNAMAPMQRKRLKAGLMDLKARYGTDRLSFRVSLDHHTQELHEKERGARTWAPSLNGIDWLAQNGFTIALAGRTCWGEAEADARAGYARLARGRGWPINAADPQHVVLFPEMDGHTDVPEITTRCWAILHKSPSDMMCASSRMVVKRKGAAQATIVPCTLIPYAREFDMGPTLASAAAIDGGMFDKGAVKLCHPHCAKFCVLGGGSCS